MVCTSAPAGWNEFLLDFLVQTTATADSWISDSHHKMPVFDVRSLPGDTVSFPAVRNQGGTWTIIAGSFMACRPLRTLSVLGVGFCPYRARLSQMQPCWCCSADEGHCCLALPFRFLAAPWSVGTVTFR